jgi:hypothetical protein
LTRRNWITALAGSGLVHAGGAQTADPRPRVACILNTWFPNSHADVFVSRLLDGYRLNGAWHAPRLRTVNFYVDQFPENDMAREQAAEYGIRICSSVAEAVKDVDGIAVIGEHGQYPRSRLGNFQYPRKRYFDEITRVFAEHRRPLPLFNDKYLAYEWTDARSMYDRVRSTGIPFLCGSTLPWTWRRPPLELPPQAEFEQLMAVSYSDLEEHAYHAIELLQSVAERRKGGETGVAQVRYAEGDEVWRISPELRDAALERRVNPPPTDTGQKPEAFLIRYRDGLEASVLNLNSKTRDYLFAARVKGVRRPASTCFYIGLYTHAHWGFLVQAFENLVLTRRAKFPIERTLLANGIMLAGLESRSKGGAWVDTPHLRVAYS